MKITWGCGPLKEDSIAITILDDGTIRVETDQISPANHLSADQFLKEIERLAGGEITKTKNRHGHQHVITHTHAKQGG